MKKYLCAAACAALLAPVAASAASFQNNFGLNSPVLTIDFSGSGLNTGDSVTNQFAGLTFSPSLRLNSQGDGGGDAFPGIDGDYVGNNFPCCDNPFSVFFDVDQTDVGMGYATNPAETTITALLDGAIIESAVFNTDFSTNGFFGFTGITFDQIQFEVSGDQQILLDNFQLGSNPAPVPLPASLPLVAGGLIALGAIKRRRKS